MTAAKLFRAEATVLNFKPSVNNYVKYRLAANLPQTGGENTRDEEARQSFQVTHYGSDV